MAYHPVQPPLNEWFKHPHPRRACVERMPNQDCHSQLLPTARKASWERAALFVLQSEVELAHAQWEQGHMGQHETANCHTRDRESWEMNFRSHRCRHFSSSTAPLWPVLKAPRDFIQYGRLTHDGEKPSPIVFKLICTSGTPFPFHAEKWMGWKQIVADWGVPCSLVVWMPDRRFRGCWFKHDQLHPWFSLPVHYTNFFL